MYAKKTNKNKQVVDQLSSTTIVESTISLFFLSQNFKPLVIYFFNAAWFVSDLVRIPKPGFYMMWLIPLIL